MTLAETQALFHEAITTDEPLEVGALGARLEACFAGTARLPAVERVAIYAGMFRSRLVEGLRATYPSLASALGDGRFATLALHYLRAHPSTHHDIGQVGRALASFLRVHPDPARPDLAALAELEWARQEVFFALASEPVTSQAFEGLDAGSFSRAAVELSPALHLLALDHDPAPLWLAVMEGGPPGPPAPRPCAVAVWRSGFEVFHAQLEAEEAEALRRAAAGAPLGHICEAFSEREAPAEAAHAALSGWLTEGWVVGVRPPPRP